MGTLLSVQQFVGTALAPQGAARLKLLEAAAQCAPLEPSPELPRLILESLSFRRFSRSERLRRRLLAGRSGSLRPRRSSSHLALFHIASGQPLAALHFVAVDEALSSRLLEALLREVQGLDPASPDAFCFVELSRISPLSFLGRRAEEYLESLRILREGNLSASAVFRSFCLSAAGDALGRDTYALFRTSRGFGEDEDEVFLRLCEDGTDPFLAADAVMALR